jgi:hypothetical protein
VHRGLHKKQKVGKAEENDDDTQEEASEKADKEKIKQKQGQRGECCDAVFL